jgi:hypothetical protein
VEVRQRFELNVSVDDAEALGARRLVQLILDQAYRDASMLESLRLALVREGRFISSRKSSPAKSTSCGRTGASTTSAGATYWSRPSIASANPSRAIYHHGARALRSVDR